MSAFLFLPDLADSCCLGSPRDIEPTDGFAVSWV